MAETLSLAFPDISCPKVSDFLHWNHDIKPGPNTSGYQEKETSPSWLHQTQKTGSSLWETISPFALDWGMNALPIPFAAVYNAYSVYESAQSVRHQENNNSLGAIVKGGLLTLSVVSMFLPLLGAVRKKAPDLSVLKKLFSEYVSEADYLRKMAKAPLTEANFLQVGLNQDMAKQLAYMYVKRGAPDPEEVKLFAFIKERFDEIDPSESIREVLEIMPGFGGPSVTLVRAGRFDHVILADRVGEYSSSVTQALKDLKINHVTQHPIPDLTPHNIAEVGQILPPTPHVLMVHPTVDQVLENPINNITHFLAGLGHQQTYRKVLFFDYKESGNYDFKKIIELVKKETGQTWKITQIAEDNHHYLVVLENVVQNL